MVDQIQPKKLDFWNFYESRVNLQALFRCWNLPGIKICWCLICARHVSLWSCQFLLWALREGGGGQGDREEGDKERGRRGQGEREEGDKERGRRGTRRGWEGGQGESEKGDKERVRRKIRVKGRKECDNYVYVWANYKWPVGYSTAVPLTAEIYFSSVCTQPYPNNWIESLRLCPSNKLSVPGTPLN